MKELAEERGAATKLPRRKFLQLASGAAALPLAPHVARAQAYPTRPVRVVVAFAAGGPNDIMVSGYPSGLDNRLLSRTDRALVAQSAPKLS
jgi:hypothetical protein